MTDGSQVLVKQRLQAAITDRNTAQSCNRCDTALMIGQKRFRMCSSAAKQGLHEGVSVRCSTAKDKY